MSLCFGWSTADTINSLLLLVSILTTILLYKTFTEGSKQTAISTSITQLSIYNAELNDFIQEAKQLKFQTRFVKYPFPLSKHDFESANGAAYLTLFSCVSKPHDLNPDSEEVDIFRDGLLFPLERFYDRLLHFLEAVQKDEILSKNHKNLIYDRAERDIFQHYFRLCNFKSPLTKELNYDLQVFDTLNYRTESFYRINQFYIVNELFQFKDLGYYQTNN